MSTGDWKLIRKIEDELEGRRDFEGVTPQPSLTKAKLEGLEEVESLDGIGKVLPNVEWLDLSCAKRLHDVDGASKLKRLRALELYFCERLENVDGLLGHPTLALVCLRGTKVERKEVPQPLRKACTWAWLNQSKLESMAQRGAPKKTVRSRELASLRKLLKSGERETIEQGIELAIALGTDAFDRLTESIRLESVGVSAASRHGVEHRLASRTFRGDAGHYPMVALLARAPGGTRLAKARDALDRLDLIGKVPPRQGERPVSLDHLSLLPIKELEAQRFSFADGPLKNDTLESIYLRDSWLPGRSVADLVAASALKSLRLQTLPHLQSLEGVQALPLETLSLLWTGVRSLAPLRGHPTLRSVFADVRYDLAELSTLPELRTVRVEESALPKAVHEQLLERGVEVRF